jgi:hypothetical protein
MAIHTNRAKRILQSLFFAPRTNRADEPLHSPGARVGPRRADFPGTQRFPGAGSHGKFGNIILLAGAGHHQPNLTGPPILSPTRRFNAPHAI